MFQLRVYRFGNGVIVMQNHHEKLMSFLLLISLILTCAVILILYFVLSWEFKIALGFAFLPAVLTLILAVIMRIHYPENRFGKILFRFYLLLILLFLLGVILFLIKECSSCIESPPSL